MQQNGNALPEGRRRLTSYLGVPDAPTLVAGPPDKARLFANRERCITAHHGLTPNYEPEDAFAVYLHLCDFARLDLWRDGRRMITAPYRTGATILYNLDQRWRANMIDPFDCLHLHVTRATLDELSYELGGRPLDTMRCAPQDCELDPVLLGLGQSLLPGLAEPDAVNKLFIDHLANTINIHLATRYGGLSLGARRAGGLAPWQGRRAKDHLLSHLADDISLDELARECSLSRSQFSRAFRATTGLPPHRWLLLQRIERAKALLTHKNVSLAQAAQFTGFADQSHFTRSFTHWVGVSPGKWRRGRGA